MPIKRRICKLEQVEIRRDELKKCKYLEKSKLNILAFIIVIDLVLGGAGRVLMIGSAITIRYFLFILAMSYFIFKCIFNNFKTDKNIFYGSVVIFFFFYFISIMNGLFNGYAVGDILLSSQGYLYLFMIFPFTLFIDKIGKVKAVFRIFNRSAVLLAVLSIIIFLIFKTSPATYSVINPVLLNLKYGHLSMRYGLASVFFKTSVYMAIVFIHELFQYVNLNKERSVQSIVRMILLLLGCMTTMTMGIWIALVMGSIICILLLKGSKKVVSILTVITLISIIFLTFSEFIITVLSSRLSTGDSSYIIKVNQLYTMLNVWLENILFGKGFGVRILFVSEIATREMAKFELFWIELLINMGLIGFVAYTYMIIKTIFKGLKIAKVVPRYDSTQIKALITGLIMLCIISSVNPFLNNPIGLGYFIIVMCSVNVYYRKIKSFSKECQ